MALCLCAPAPAGILVSRSDKGLQFTDAFAVTVNGKDKVLAMGRQPRIPGPIGKLPNARLGGILLRDGTAAILALYSPGEATYILPEGLPKNTPADPAAIWRTARISFRKSASDKTATDLPAAEFVAFLPGGAEELTRLCLDERALELVGGSGKTFATQLDWLAAVIPAYASDPAMVPLEQYVESAMRQRYERFESGTAGVDVLEQGLKLAELSQKVFPNQPRQAALRKVLTDRKAWLARKNAVLHAFAAAQEWDAYLLGDHDFERFRQAYPEMMGKHTEALKKSLEFHRQAGEQRMKDSQYGAAYREFRVASLRQPFNDDLQQRTRMAWSEYSRQTAIDHQGERRQLKASERDAIDQALDWAGRYKSDHKLDEAKSSVEKAEKIDPESLAVLLKKAEVLGARHEFDEALRALDEYDKHAVDEERERKPANALRNDLLYQRTSSLENSKSQLKKAWDAANYHQVRQLSLEGLRAKDDDAELLYYAGLTALITRNANDARDRFTRYLEVSNTLEADETQRARVRSLLAAISQAAPPADSGESNWMSGKRLPKGVFYCPVSLAFQPRVEHIEASNKLRVTYEWEGERLKAIVPTFEKTARPTGEKKISFADDPHAPQVASVAYEDAARSPTGTDPDELVRSSSLVVLNNPYEDPAAVQNLTGKNVTLGIAGNRFFQPFVWDRIHYFRFTYDDQGRVRQAREIADPKAAPGDQWLEFEWNEMQLTAVRGYQGDEKHRTKIYDRTLQYQSGRLVSEHITGQGGSSHITYNYNGNRLVSADCGTDSTLDGRSRKVQFVAGSPSTLAD